MQTDVDEVSYREASIGEEAAARPRIVLTTSSRRRRQAKVRIVAVAEPASQTADLIVTRVCRVSRKLHNHVRSNVVGVVRGGVVQTTTGTCIADEEVRI